MAYIGIDRGIEDHWIYQDAEYFKVWFEILLRARFSKEPEKKMQDGKFFTIEYGQFMFGRVSWSERLGVSEQRLRTLLKKLINDNMIELISTYPKFSIYSVKNYAKFNHQSNHQQSLTEQGFEGDTNQQINSVSTINQPSTNQQLTTQEESKEVKKVKKEIINKHVYAEFVKMTESEFSKLAEKYGEEFTQKCIEKLDNHVGATGQKYTSDYRAILKWVVDAVNRDQRNAQPKYSNSMNGNHKQPLRVVESIPGIRPSAEERETIRRRAMQLDSNKAAP